MPSKTYKQKTGCQKLQDWGFPAFVLVVVGSIYAAFVFLNLLPQYQNLNGGTVGDPNVWKVGAVFFWTIAILFHVCFFMLLISFFRAMITPPGTIPQSDMWMFGRFDLCEEHESFIKGVLKHPDTPLDPHIVDRLMISPLVERKKDLQRRTCDKGTCGGYYKPDRSHHCARCQSCVLRMDHHCPWINNCVGFYNHKFFILLLIYASLSSLMVVAFLGPRAFAVLVTPSTAGFWSFDFPILVAWTFSLLLFIPITMFLITHIKYIMRATTTIESKEKENPRTQNVALAKRTMWRWRVANSKFNHGPYLNMVHVMGPVYTWLIPSQPYTIEDGTYYDCRDYIGYRQTFAMKRGKARIRGGAQPQVC